MIGALLPVVLLVSIATLAVAIVALRSSRRSEELGEDRYELLSDQQERLKLLHEERQMLSEELKRESQERQRFIEEWRPHAAKDLEQGRRRLEQELKRSKEEVGSVGRGPRANRAGQPGGQSPWWRRPVLIVGLLLGALAVWLASLVVALNLLSP